MIYLHRKKIQFNLSPAVYSVSLIPRRSSASLALHNRSAELFSRALLTSDCSAISPTVCGGSSAFVNSSYLRERGHFCGAQSGAIRM